jgi:GxxExxY protein
MDERDPLTEVVIGAAVEVHREMGPGLLESVYQKCLVRELRLRNIECQPQSRLPLINKDQIIDDDDLVMDIYFPGRLVVELKAVEKLLPIHDPIVDVLVFEQDPHGLAHKLQCPTAEGRPETHGSLTAFLSFSVFSVTLWLGLYSCPTNHRVTENTEKETSNCRKNLTILDFKSAP